MTSTTIADAYKTTKPRRAKTPPPPITPAEAFSDDFKHMSQDQINRRFKVIADGWRAEEQVRQFFSGRVSDMYAGPRLFRYIDLFCGAGGSSTGLTMAGGQLLKALNHSQRNIETHSTNFPMADHECADINHYDMRNLPKGAEVLWASPICTEISPAGGKTRTEQPGEDTPDEILKYGQVDQDMFERTRATAYDVIRACEVHHFPIVIVENVVEFCTDWKLFAWWLMGMQMLGYEPQIVCANSAHIEGPVSGTVAPQSRDRFYVIFNRRDVAKPDVRVQPRSWCGNCAQEVRGEQTWKQPDGYMTESGRKFLVGKYGIRSGQYYFTCPNTGCGETVHPIVRPAASVINFNYLGDLIGDRKRPLVENSRKRVRRGMIEIALAGQNGGPEPFLDANGGSWNTGPASVREPFRTRTTKDWEGLCVPPGAFVDTARNHAVPTSVYDPFTTMAAGGNHQAIVIPYNRTAVPFPADEQPFNTMTTRDRHAIVIPYTQARARSANEPFNTITTKNQHGLLTGWDGAASDPALLEELIDQSRYRMVQWYEQLLAQAFPLDYLMTGNIGERTAGAGNAVSANVAEWFGCAAGEALNRTAAHAAVPTRRGRAKAGAR